jgi:hypothetical protein
MKQVLLNLALIQLSDFCRSRGISVSGSHVAKSGRGFRYRLLRTQDGTPIAEVLFSKSSVPRFFAC